MRVGTLLMAAAVAVATLTGLAWPERASAQQGRIPCGEFYEVRPGDTLREIAIAAYGVGSYQLIYNANQDILRRPSLLLVGQQLFIPCLDGSGPANRQEAARALQAGAQATAEPQQAPQPEVQAQPTPQPGAEEADGAGRAAAQPVPGVDETGGAGDEDAAAAQAVPQAPPSGGGTDAADTAPGSQPVPAAGGSAGARASQAAQPPEQSGNGVDTAGSTARPGTQPLPTANGDGGAARTVPMQGDAAAGAAADTAAASIQPPAQGGNGAGADAGGGAASAQLPAQTGAAGTGISVDPDQAASAQVAQPPVQGGDAAATRDGAEARLGPRATAEPTQQQPAPVEPLPSLLPTGEPQETADPAASVQARLQPRAGAGADAGGAAPQPGVPAQQDGTALAAIPPAEEEAPELPAIRLITGPYAPYTGETLPQKGMLSEVVTRAFEIAAPGRETRITFINDWASHIKILMPDGVFDVGLPWFRPDCTKFDLLSEDMQLRCTDYNWSAPLQELVIGYFVRPDSDLTAATSYDELVGTTLCRPRGFYTFDLEQEGLAPPAIEWIRPDSVEQCLDALADGEADVVPISVNVVEDAAREMGLEGQIAEVPALAGIVTMHAISPKTNPQGRVYLTLINRGLRQLRASGEWFEIVSRHMARHAQQAQ